MKTERSLLLGEAVPIAGPPAAKVKVHPRPSEDEEPALLRRRREGLRPWRKRRWLRWLRALAVLLAAASVPAALGTWLLTSPRFALAGMEVAAGERVSEAWVRQTLAPFAGRNLLLLSLGAVDRRLAEHRWLAAADLRKELPNRLGVRVIERREVALLRRGKELLYLDGDGREIAHFDPGAAGGADLVVVTPRPGESLESIRPEKPGRDGSEADAVAALALLRELDTAAPAWLEGLSEIEVLGTEDFRVYATDLPCPLLLRAGTVAERARRLEELLPEIVARYGPVREIDLRFARRIIVQPSTGGGVEEGPGRRAATIPAPEAEL